MPEARVRVPDRDLDFPIRVNGTSPTFQLRADKISGPTVSPIAPVFLDFLDVAAVVFAADGQVSRGGVSGSAMGSDWRRAFRFSIPVRCRSLWETPAVTGALVDLIRFISDDTPEFAFTDADPELPREPFLAFSGQGSLLSADEVVLFSGGLDSFAGALETLSTTTGKVVLLSHRSAQKVTHRQKTLAKSLTARFSQRCLPLGVEATQKGVGGRETTQRTRTLLFGALAAATASAFDARRISLFENGVVSHNLPISPQVVGSMATRTTHPLTLHKLNTLISLLDAAAPRIENHYEWLTKFEVVERNARYGGQDLIKATGSCAHVREQTLLHPHCGCCSQCLDRRFAMMAAAKDQHDPVENFKVDVLSDAIPEGTKRTMAVEWTRHARTLVNSTETLLLEKFGQEIARVCQGHPDLEARDVLARTLDMHRRHADAIVRVLSGMIVRQSKDLATGTVDPHSLLGMHVADGLGAELSQDRASPLMTLPDADDDLIPAADEPLSVAFFHEGEIPAIGVRGLCEVRGKPAAAAHALKQVYDEDRAQGLESTTHRYVAIHGRGDVGLSKESARSAVSRCRRELATAYQDVHGHKPAGHLLIQNRSPQGYRLDPATRIIEKAALDPGSN